MKKLVISLFVILFFAGIAAAADVTLAWDANSETDLAGYKLHWGTVNQVPFSDSLDVANVTQYMISGLAEDTTYYFAVTAYDTGGNESQYSNIIEYVVRPGQVVIRIIDRPKGIRMVFE